MKTLLSERRFISFDETPVFYRVIAPEDAVRGLVFVLHGMGEHGGRYEFFARHLAAHGFECWLPDLRGFGKSGGARGAVRRFSDYEKDLEAVYALAEKNHRGLPFYWIGHSFGGLLVSRMAALHRMPRLKALILSSPLFGIALPVPAPLDLLARADSFLAPGYAQSSGVPEEFLTHDVAIRAARAADPLVHSRITVRLYTEMKKALSESLKTAASIPYPALVLQAGDDRVVSKEKTAAFYSALPNEDKCLKIYENWYHEILNEAGREKVFALVADWLIKHS